MAPATGPSPDESPEAQFRRVLADVAARRGAPGARGARRSAVRPVLPPIPSRARYFQPTTIRAAGGGRRFALACRAGLARRAGWPGGACRIAVASVDDSAEAILAELGLAENLTERELSRLRRLYMWRNHPDRHRESQRANATRRVAIANMLLDRARSRLISRPAAVGATGAPAATAARGGLCCRRSRGVAAAARRLSRDSGSVAALPTAPRLGNVDRRHCVGWEDSRRPQIGVLSPVRPNLNGPP